jgi:stearoyl-CoA desaturase (delta-9 desaturase)
VWGFLISTILVYHATFTINSLSHLFGKRRYNTPDDSRNNIWLALITLGEGWHNNHHHYQSSANQGFFWWEIDISYYVIRLMGFCGLVWDIRKPGEKAINFRRVQPAAK